MGSVERVELPNGGKGVLVQGTDSFPLLSPEELIVVPKKILSALILHLCSSNSYSQAVEGYYPVSVMQLVVTPEKYVNQRVRVKGYIETGTFLTLYSNHLSAAIGDTESGVEVIDRTDEGELTLSCNKKYVVLSGRFIEQQKHYEITDVMDALDAKTLKPCWTKAQKR